MISDKGIRSGAEDVKHDKFSIESKHGKSAVSAFILKAYEQCVKNAPPDKVPMVVLHRTNSKQYFAVIDLQDLMEVFSELDAPFNTGSDSD